MPVEEFSKAPPPLAHSPGSVRRPFGDAKVIRRFGDILDNLSAL
jgi:hypothetical protein